MVSGLDKPDDPSPCDPPSGFAIYPQSHDILTTQGSLIYVSIEVKYAQILLEHSRRIV